MIKRPISRHYRRHRVALGMLNSNLLHVRNPFVSAWWSAAFPGLSYLMLGIYPKGLALVIWEVIVNYNAKINTAMLYSFTGQFEAAKQVLDLRWTLLYIAVYIYGIWDSYRLTVELNKLTVLAERDQAPVIPFKISPYNITFLDKRPPAIPAIWSMLMPGLGHLCIRAIPTGVLLLFGWIATTYMSHLLEAVHFTLIGRFAEARDVLVPEWFLFMPSIYGFAVYDTYSITVESNKLFKAEQSQYLERYHQPSRFAMPV